MRLQSVLALLANVLLLAVLAELSQVFVGRENAISLTGGSKCTIISRATWNCGNKQNILFVAKFRGRGSVPILCHNLPVVTLLILCVLSIQDLRGRFEVP